PGSRLTGGALRRSAQTTASYCLLISSFTELTRKFRDCNDCHVLAQTICRPCKGIKLWRERDLGSDHQGAIPILRMKRISFMDEKTLPRQSGMLPCFFGGFLSRLFRSMAKAVISFRRVKRGSMISSTYPRSAAMYGLANFSLYSAIFASRSFAPL